jgi:ceramide glucosyltransferase
MLTAIAFTIVSVASLILTSTQALITFLFRRRERPFEDGRPGAPSRPADSLVSILKPVCGLDDELEENLLSFVSLRGIQYEVIISIEDRNDPALPIAAAAVRDHPDVFRVVVGNGMRDGVANRKVDRLISAARVARGEILFISDSNVRVQPEDIRKTIAAFENPRVGCVSNLFAGSGAQDLGASIESLHLAAFVTPGCALAAAASVPCVVGKSMAISRAALRAIGGFEAFRRVLAEDQAIGLAVKKAGYEVTLSPVVVRNVIVSRTLRRALERQIRWNKIRYAFSRTLYAAEILLQPLPLAAMAVLFGASPLLLTVVLLSRIATAAMIGEATEARVRPWLMPLLDAMMFLAWFVPFFSNRITWRGYTARIVKGTELVPAEAAA